MQCKFKKNYNNKNNRYCKWFNVNAAVFSSISAFTFMLFLLTTLGSTVFCPCSMNACFCSKTSVELPLLLVLLHMFQPLLNICAFLSSVHPFFYLLICWSTLETVLSHSHQNYQPVLWVTPFFKAPESSSTYFPHKVSTRTPKTSASLACKTVQDFKTAGWWLISVYGICLTCFQSVWDHRLCGWFVMSPQ